MVDAARVPPPQAPIPAPAPSKRRPKSRKGRGVRNACHERPASTPATDSASTPPTQGMSAPPTAPPVSSTPSAAPERRHRRQKTRKPRDSGKKGQEPTQEQPARARAPRRSFGAHLTVAEPATEVAPPPPIPEYADLRTRLTAELSTDEYDCAICYHPVLRKQPIWSCARCHAVLHLPCVRTWAERSVQQMEEHNRLHEDPDVREQRGHWRCPACQAVQETVPRTYRCWCGRVTQPRAHAVPHSCGSKCRRGCAWHGCAADVCHPGPCPPCAATVRVACYCGREPERLVRCSQWRATLSAEQAMLPLDELQRQGTISCGAVCGRPLACGHHTCPQPCHAGPCGPCAQPLDAVPCHCGRHTRSMLCGERAAEAFGLTSAWSCGEPCNAPFACGVHRCTRPCHVRTGVAPCPHAPERVKTCPCGRTPVTDRTDCRDPIPTCGQTCGRPRPCGHTCAAPCHAGDCPPCAADVVQVCRCGASKRTRPCALATEDEFLCTTPCKALRHCGKHVCGRACCPLAFQATLKATRSSDLAQLDPQQLHACDIPCRRPLSCGQHVCEALCHRGACAPCLRSSFTEAVCPCGRTVIEPPVPCGTVIVCSYPCALPGPPCGHPKVEHACHPADTPCPPCVHLTTRVCVCGRTTFPSVPCSRTFVRCGQVCGKPLACGQHTCTGTCHADGECAPCTQVCGRARSPCGHPCLQPCHAPAPCPDTPCDAVVRRTCPCGHREKLDVCGSGSPLACTAACEVAQRNARFASALGLRVAPAHVDYAPALRQYVARDARGAQAVQDVLNDFVQSPRAAAQVRALLVAHALRHGLETVRPRAPLLAFVEQLAAVYHVATERITEGPEDVRLRRTRESRIPPVLLTEASAAPAPTQQALEARHAQQQQQQQQQQNAALAAAWQQPEGEALVLQPLPPTLRTPEALNAALTPVARGPPSCTWSVSMYDHVAVLHTVKLAPLSVAAVAQATAQPEASALRPKERRLFTLCGAMQSALPPGLVVELGAWDGARATHVFRQGQWTKL